MKTSTPCSATNTSMNANGEITGIFAVECATDEIISIDIQIDVDANNNDTFFALINKTYTVQQPHIGNNNNDNTI